MANIFSSSSTLSSLLLHAAHLDGYVDLNSSAEISEVFMTLSLLIAEVNMLKYDKKKVTETEI